ncbi:GNAT family N-acetyltransferase [Halobacillus litoralis]|uniref:GNAT family N-acetyltransferase n=1 Tax=Halobacillus litoralis TaxID=45668 RepID=UPI001CD4289F|nr:GNAT family N-acetyltransferase [Halobacillus litoralis]MCA0969196.1 GNAT family N-acetyltransferase [Halobacillus litoralis]
MTEIRESECTDGHIDFLTDMIYEAIYMPDNKPEKQKLLREPHLIKYSKHWGKPGDKAFFAYDGNGLPVGAAWYRLFPEEEKGYGFIDEETPELGIAITDTARGKGLGEALMKRLIQAAQEEGRPALSLSVDSANEKALALYKKLGFIVVDDSGSSWTMKIDCRQRCKSE